jgi:hypothetical protein
MLNRRFILLAAVLCSAGGARAASAPTIAVLTAYYEGSMFSSRPDGPANVPAALFVDDQVPSNGGIRFEGRHADLFGFVVPVEGKVSAKNKISYKGNGGLGKLGTRSPEPSGGLDARLTVSVTGRISANHQFIYGTYKNTYKDFGDTPTNPFKDFGGAFLQDDT